MARAKRAGQPAELAAAYVILADPLSGYTSGSTIAVTGGNLTRLFIGVDRWIVSMADDAVFAEHATPIRDRGRRTMRENGRPAMKIFLSLLFALMLASGAGAQDSPYRRELQRGDLTGTNMEVITSIIEIKPGEVSTLHIHHGEETYYVLSGTAIETPDGKREAIPTGAIGMNARDVPHGAYKVIGDTPLRLLTIQIVDKGRPLYDKPE